MKRILALLLFIGLALSSFGQVVPTVPRVNASPNGAVGPAGLVTTSSGLTVQVSPGPIYCNGSLGWVAQTNLTLPASTTIFIWFDCSNETVIANASYLQSPATVLLDTTITAAASITSNTDNRLATQFPIWTDGYFVVPPSACAFKTSGTAGTNHNTVQPDGASLTPALLASSTAAGASNSTLTCNIVVPTRITAGHGIVLNDITVMYGVQTTALTSLGAPTISTVALPVAGASETPSTVTPVTAGAVTVTPVVGSGNLGTTTAGAYFTEKVALNTPVAVQTDLQVFLFQQVFAQSAAAAQVVNVPGLLVHYTNVLP